MNGWRNWCLGVRVADTLGTGSGVLLPQSNECRLASFGIRASGWILLKNHLGHLLGSRLPPEAAAISPLTSLPHPQALTGTALYPPGRERLLF